MEYIVVNWTRILFQWFLFYLGASIYSSATHRYLGKRNPRLLNVEINIMQKSVKQSSITSY